MFVLNCLKPLLHTECSMQEQMAGMAKDVQTVAHKAHLADEAASLLTKLEEKFKAANEKNLRLNADFDNFRKRSVSLQIFSSRLDLCHSDILNSAFPVTEQWHLHGLHSAGKAFDPLNKVLNSSLLSKLELDTPKARLLKHWFCLHWASYRDNIIKHCLWIWYKSHLTM